MPERVFVAFASSDALLAETIRDACNSARVRGVEFSAWNMKDASGQQIGSAVYQWVDDADALIADISEPNHNVTYEIGLAIGMGKPLRLIKSDGKDWARVQEVGLLHNVGHDAYGTQAALRAILEKGLPPSAPWSLTKKNREAPIYLLQSSEAGSLLNSRVTSSIKKTVKRRFRSFNPREIDRLTASEAVQQISSSIGVIAIWHDANAPESFRQNHRTAFAVGLARGLGMPFLLLAEVGQRLPLDLDEVATRWALPSDVDVHFRSFRDDVAEFEQEYVEVRGGEANLLDTISCGEPMAENEQAGLGEYFLQTEPYRATFRGELNVVLGRKGSGKTAIFLQVRDNTRVDRKNIVVDLAPESYQLVKLKEFILKHLNFGTRKEFIAAFWEYIVLLEIAYKLLEKDAKAARYDSDLMKRFDRLSEVYNRRVDTGSGDFSERIARLVERIVGRYEGENKESGVFASSRVLEIVHGEEIRPLRDEVLSYLRVKGCVFFLFDNIDRFWISTGFDDTDAQIIVGLIEGLQEIRKRFDRAKIQFLWATFIRSDVWEFVVKGMADYGKVLAGSAEWNDRELLEHLFEQRITSSLPDQLSWRQVWETITISAVHGRRTLDFLIDASLMRPRYLIRLFETARQRAVTLQRKKIEEDDYDKALEELGWQVLEDLGRELVDIVPDAEDLLFEITALGGVTSPANLRALIQRRINDVRDVEAVIDVLIWAGCVGVEGPKGPTYISDCGFRRPFIRALMNDPIKQCVLLHPTLSSLVSG